GESPLLFAAIQPDTGVAVEKRGFYNGKIDRPVIFDRALDSEDVARLRRDAPPGEIDAAALVGAWDFSQDMQSANLVDIGRHHLHGTLVNYAMRAVTGHDWSGDDEDFKHAPGQYGAIHFHDDDIEDAGWETDFSWTVPADAVSGFYAARLQSG